MWQRWPLANVGTLTGECHNRLVTDLDIDELTIGQLEELAGIGGVRTPALVSGSGGQHRIWLFPVGQDVRCSADARIAPGFHVRANRGLEVLPPSLHKSGQQYSWLPGLSPEDVPLAQLPAELVQRMLKKFPDSGNWHSDRPVSGPFPVSGKVIEWPVSPVGSMADYWLQWAVRTARAGTRHHTGNTLAVLLHNNAVGIDEARTAMLRYAHAVNSLDEKDPYTPDEALSSLEWAYSQVPMNGTYLVSLDTHQVAHLYPTQLIDPDKVKVSEAATAADAMPATGPARRKGTPAQLRRQAQYQALADAWAVVYPDRPPRPEDLRRWLAMVPQDGKESTTLVRFLFAVYDAPHGAAIQSPRAHFTASLCRAVGREYHRKPKPKNAPQTR
jgi:hypothetical protein